MLNLNIIIIIIGRKSGAIPNLYLASYRCTESPSADLFHPNMILINEHHPCRKSLKNWLDARTTKFCKLRKITGWHGYPSCLHLYGSTSTVQSTKEGRYKNLLDKSLYRLALCLRFSMFTLYNLKERVTWLLFWPLKSEFIILKFNNHNHANTFHWPRSL